ncbi:phytanoyl-CoA dioxygenase family protein [Aquihabitans sp. G128]|uniref:phytanoyl-CoA dioxygenase family protein n=1 Tax=Aquihabitans sp. G128 TaxID=2849779 RepID=UPI001C23E37C|nr:phytanoyl-CoA dioxygenase family protein [Aquihabitans sp. G128]QXC63240.1 phytanoyl-CoA dioxygenase family protein [Aquihabitans sp. G128]
MVLSASQVAAYERDGFLVVPDAIPHDACDALIARATQLVDEFDPSTVSVFSTKEQTRTSDEHFLASGDGITCFFEEEAFAPDGSLRQDKALSINKIGHAMHDLDPVFDAFSRQPAIAEAAAAIGMADPKLLQSMYIFKSPRIGGEVTCHQDSAFLYTDPMTVVGFWVALQDATLENGCLWAQPGGHRTPLRQRFVLDPAGGTRFEQLDDTPWPEPGGPELVPLEAKKGTMVLLHGLLPHWSDVNRSERSRHAYTVHVIDAAADYPAENWLQRHDPALPFRGFDRPVPAPA